MADSDNTDIKNKRGALGGGDTVGHASGDNKVRSRDGFFLPGEELGYVDKEGQVRHKDGWLGRGEVVGKIRRDSAYGKDGMIFPGEEWGYVDDQGQIWLKEGMFGRRVIGAVHGKNKAGALAYFMLQFDTLVQECDELAAEVRDNKWSTQAQAGLLAKVRSKLRYLGVAKALGDFDSLASRLRSLEGEVLERMQSNHRDKLNLCVAAEVLSESSDWKQASEGFKDLHQRWKATGPVPNQDDADQIWHRFRAAEERFRARSRAHFEQKDRERQANAARKQQLCSQADALSGSTDWKATGDEFARLHEEWKSIGPVPKEQADALWNRFQNACNRFRNRRQAHFQEQDRQREANASSKRSLINRAAALSGSSDWKATGEEMGALLAEWKTVGPASRDQGQDLWEQFQRSRSRFFDRRSEFFAQREREENQNLREKEDLCREAEGLRHSGDLRAAADRVKELQAEWKSIGHVRREDADRVWQRFRLACDFVFDAARDEREAKQEEWRQKTTDALHRKRESVDQLEESIAHDEGLIEHWQDVIDGLGGGGRAAEIQDSMEEKIASVQDKIQSKRERIRELDAAIRDMESKL